MANTWRRWSSVYINMRQQHKNQNSNVGAVFESRNGLDLHKRLVARICWNPLQQMESSQKCQRKKEASLPALLIVVQFRQIVKAAGHLIDFGPSHGNDAKAEIVRDREPVLSLHSQLSFRR